MANQLLTCLGSLIEPGNTLLKNASLYTSTLLVRGGDVSMMQMHSRSTYMEEVDEDIEETATDTRRRGTTMPCSAIISYT